MMKTLTKLGGAAAMCLLLGSVQAATVKCPGALGVAVPGGDPATRQIEVTGALAGGECYFKEGNFQGDDVSAFLGTNVLIEKDIAPNGGTTGLLNYTGTVVGTWAMTSNLWTTYNEIFIAFHFGNGGGDPDSFVVELDPGARSAATSGNWTWVPSTIDQALSNIYLFGRGNANGGGSTNGNGGGVPEPATLALVGLGLLGAAAARRRQRV